MSASRKLSAILRSSSRCLASYTPHHTPHTTDTTEKTRFSKPRTQEMGNGPNAASPSHATAADLDGLVEVLVHAGRVEHLGRGALGQPEDGALLGPQVQDQPELRLHTTPNSINQSITNQDIVRGCRR